MTDFRSRIEDITREGDRDQLITSQQAARLLGLKAQTIENWGRSGKLPRVVLSSRAIRYRLADVRQLIRERTE